MKLSNDKSSQFIDFLNSYNQCFYQKDIQKLRGFYSQTDDDLIYFDNHKNNDTYTVRQHLDLLSEFFKKGKSTESGGVEPVIMEIISVFSKGEAACICFLARYKSFPDPAVRCTLYLEFAGENWKIVHAHYSFQPDK